MCHQYFHCIRTSDSREYNMQVFEQHSVQSNLTVQALMLHIPAYQSDHCSDNQPFIGV